MLLVVSCIKDICFESLHKHGIDEDQPRVHPTVLDQYYGVEVLPRHHHPGQTGAGHPDEDDDAVTIDNEELEYTEHLIGDDLEESIRHDTIPVPPKTCPFSPTSLDVFLATLSEVQEQGIVPDGYGLKTEEWEETFYPLSETIMFGVGGKKKLNVILSVDLWWQGALA